MPEVVATIEFEAENDDEAKKFYEAIVGYKDTDISYDVEYSEMKGCSGVDWEPPGRVKSTLDPDEN